jgi:hypothetical protein
MNQLNRFIKISFVCDKCQGKFIQDTVYSPNPNLEQLKETYCADCAKIIEKEKTKIKVKKRKTWGIAPIHETTENIQSLNLDKRTLKKTGRIHLFATRVKKEWIEQLKSIAYEERLHYNELLEKALECYEKHRNK